MKTIGDRIRWIIETYLEVKHTDFAKKVGKEGVSRQLLSRWVNDPDNPPSEESIQNIAETPKKFRKEPVSKAWIRYGTGRPLDKERPLDPTEMKVSLEQILTLAAGALGIPGQQIAERVSTEVDPDEIHALIDEHGSVRQASSSWEVRFGWRKSEIEGGRWENLSHPEDAERSSWAVSLAREKGKAVQFQARSRAKDGSFSRVLWKAAPRGGEVLAIGHIIDEDVDLDENVQILANNGA